MDVFLFGLALTIAAIGGAVVIASLPPARGVGEWMEEEPGTDRPLLRTAGGALIVVAAALLVLAL